MVTITKDRLNILVEQQGTSRSLPDSWKRAIGILKNKRINPLVYQHKARRGWEMRLKRQLNLK